MRLTSLVLKIFKNWRSVGHGKIVGAESSSGILFVPAQTLSVIVWNIAWVPILLNGMILEKKHRPIWGAFGYDNFISSRDSWFAVHFCEFSHHQTFIIFTYKDKDYPCSGYDHSYEIILSPLYHFCPLPDLPLYPRTPCIKHCVICPLRSTTKVQIVPFESV